MDGETYPMPKHGWTCFFCGENFTTPGAAADHFGSYLEDEPGCVLKVQVGGERGLIMELRKAVNRMRRYEIKVENLEYRLGVQSQDWQRITGLKSAHDVRMEMDFLEGRALTAEAIVADMAERVPAMVEASRRRVCSKPLPSVKGGKSDG